jgi:hypothetical protein
MNFSFVRQGIAYQVRTEVGNGPAVVHVDELTPQEQQSLEPAEEIAS